MLNTNINPEWIAVDWGTSNLRAWAMRGGAALAAAQSAQGMGGLRKSDFGTVLRTLIADWSPDDTMPIIACGMVGSRQGWVEAPYRAVPCTPIADQMAKVSGTALDVRVIPGLRQVTPGDVMRGEETQIAGFLALNQGWDGVICLPGTHTKWVQVSAGEVVSFQTYMTGEVFALFSGKSILRHSVEGTGWDDCTFDTAVEDALSRPEKLAARLFSIRADDLLDGKPAGIGRARLSGLLIGAELAAARPYWLGTNIAILGAQDPSQYYARALKTQGATALVADAERMTLAGLTAAFRLHKETA